MGRHNKSAKARKAKAREEKEAKAAEEKKLPETSNNGAGMEPSEPSSASPPAEVSAANFSSLHSSSDRISDSVGAKSNTLEFVREDERPQETEPINETTNGSRAVDEKGKESGWGIGAVAEGGWAQPGKGWGKGAVAEGGWAQPVTLQPSELEARQRPRVEASNPVENKNYRGGYSAQNDTRGWGDSRTGGNGRDGVRGGWGNGAVAEGGWAQPGKGWGNGAVLEGGRAQPVRLQPSELEARQRPRVEASNPVENKNYRGGYSAQNDTGGWGDSRTGGNGRDGVRGGYGHQASVSRVNESTRIESLGRLLSSVLRHRAVELGLNMRSDGYVLAQDLLKLRLKTYAGLPLSSYTFDDIKEAVRLDNKQRFGLREENGQLLIRANQGHSVQMVKSEDLLSPVTSPEEVPVCVHGTYLKYLDSIQKGGLKRMNRHHVHFATGLFKDKHVTSGMRSNSEVLIHLNVQEYLKDGMKLYRSENGVILAEGKNGVIPPNYFSKVERVRR